MNFREMTPHEMKLYRKMIAQGIKPSEAVRRILRGRQGQGK